MRRFLGGIFALVGAAVLVGALFAGLLMPVVGAAGVGARSASDGFLDLPDRLPEFETPQRSTILAADGSVLATVFLENRQPVPLRSVAPVMKDAILAIEDSRFYEHSGVDPRGLGRAVLNNAQGEDVQGASTITQQYVKNALLLAASTPEGKAEATAPTVGRKLQEARYALALEREMSKDEILEGYLNIAYFGDGAYGVEAAAQHYFSRPAAELSLPEAALLAGLVQNPSRFDPTNALDLATSRRNVVLARMLATGRIDQVTHDEAVAAPVELRVQAAPSGCEQSFAPFFCDYVRMSLLADPALGETREERASRLLEGGLLVRTSLDRKIQADAQAAVDGVLGRENRAASAVVIVEPGTGLVKAMAVNRNFGKGPDQTEVPLAVNAAYQPGSTFKLFTMVAALEQGLGPSTVLAGGDCYRSARLDNPASGCFRNAADGEGGAMDMGAAIRLSVNTWFVQLQERVGVLNVARTAEKMGVRSLPFEGDNRIGSREGSLTLGARDVSPLDMAVAYSTVAAHGKRCYALPVVEVRNSANEVVKPYAPQCEQVISPEVADTAASLLEGVVTSGTGTRAAFGRPVAGKTGTTQAYGAAWFNGFTPDLAAAVWVGDPRSGQQFPLRSVSSSIGTVPRVFGGTIPAEIFRRAMAPAHDGLEVKQIPGRSSLIASPAENRVPAVAGLPESQAQALLAAAGYTFRSDVRDEGGPVPPGTVLSQFPEPGSPLDAGGEVVMAVRAKP